MRYVPLGRKYALASGLMEISYDTGTKVILEGHVRTRSSRRPEAIFRSED